MQIELGDQLCELVQLGRVLGFEALSCIRLCSLYSLVVYYLVQLCRVKFCNLVQLGRVSGCAAWSCP